MTVPHDCMFFEEWFDFSHMQEQEGEDLGDLSFDGDMGSDAEAEGEFVL